MTFSLKTINGCNFTSEKKFIHSYIFRIKRMNFTSILNLKIEARPLLLVKISSLNTNTFFRIKLVDHKALKNTNPDINRYFTAEIKGLNTVISKRFLEMDE